MDATTVLSAIATFAGLVGAIVAALAFINSRSATRIAGDARDAAKRSADAAETEVQLMRQQMTDAAARTEPRADILVLRCSHLASDANDTTFAVAYAVHNVSTEPDVVQDVAVIVENASRSWRGGAVREHPPGQASALAPIHLRGDERIERTLEMSLGRRLDNSPRIAARLELQFDRAGCVSREFTIYQP